MTRVFQTKEAVRQKANRPGEDARPRNERRRRTAKRRRGNSRSLSLEEEAKRERCGPLLTKWDAGVNNKREDGVKDDGGRVGEERILLRVAGSSIP